MLNRTSYCAFAVLLMLALSCKAQAQSITLSLPVSNQTYVNNMPVSYSISEPNGTPQSISMQWTLTASSVPGVTVGQVWVLTLTTTNSSTSFSFNPSAVTSDTNFSSVSPNTNLPDGTYNILIRYMRPASVGGATVSSTTKTNVKTDTSTVIPTLTSPATNSTSGRTIAIDYELPETPQSNSTHLIFQNQNTTVDLTMSTAKTVAFNLDTTNISNVVILSATSTTLPDGVYTVTLQYTDTSNHPSTSTSSSNVTVRTVTPSPTISWPLSNTRESTLLFRYTLPVDALPGSAKIIAQPSNTEWTLPNERGEDLSFTPTNVQLADGVYSFILTYQDALGNAPATTIVSNVTLDLRTTIPELLEPERAAYNQIPVSFELPEEALPGSVTLTINNELVTAHITVEDSIETLTLNPKSLATSNHVTNTNIASLPDGTYSITLSYRDSDNHPEATSEALTFFIDTQTLPPTLLTPAQQSNTHPMHISYILPEEPLSGSVRLWFVGPVSVTWTMDNLTTRSINWDFTQTTVPDTAVGVEHATPTPLITGVYAVQLSYQDALGNPAAAMASLDIHITGTEPVVEASAGVNITTPEGDLISGRDGGSITINNTASTFHMHLSTEPTDPVTVTLDAGTLITLTPNTLVFDASNWNQPQAVAISKALTLYATQNITVMMGIQLSSEDKAYDKYAIEPIPIGLSLDNPPSSGCNGCAGHGSAAWLIVWAAAMILKRRKTCSSVPS